MLQRVLSHQLEPVAGYYVRPTRREIADHVINRLSLQVSFSRGERQRDCDHPDGHLEQHHEWLDEPRHTSS